MAACIRPGNKFQVQLAEQPWITTDKTTPQATVDCTDGQERQRKQEPSREQCQPPSKAILHSVQ